MSNTRVKTRQETRMEREKLERMTVEELRREVALYRLDVINTKEAMIEAIMEHSEGQRPTPDYLLPELAASAGRTAGGGMSATAEVAPVVPAGWADFCAALTTQMQLMAQTNERLVNQQQQMMQCMTTLISRDEAAHTGRTNVPSPVSLESGAVQQSGGSTISSLPPANAVSLLASQVADFGGGDEENVKLWVQRVNQVS